jgi:hypothetical protein
LLDAGQLLGLVWLSVRATLYPAKDDRGTVSHDLYCTLLLCGCQFQCASVELQDSIATMDAREREASDMQNVQRAVIRSRAIGIVDSVVPLVCEYVFHPVRWDGE